MNGRFLRLISECLLVASVAVLAALMAIPADVQAGIVEDEPLGDPGSGWINDELVNFLPNEDRNPVLATGPNGTLHSVWQHDTTGSGTWKLCYAFSADGGATWSACYIIPTATTDTNPDIVVSPLDGRIIIAYEAEQIIGNREIFVAYSDTGMSWGLTAVSATAMDEFNPSLALEHDQDPYLVHIAFESNELIDGNDLHVWVSSDRGVSWIEQYLLGVADLTIYSNPKLAYQRCTDAIPRLYMLHFSDNRMVARIIWSEDGGMSWLGPGTIWSAAQPMGGLTVAASRDGDTLMVAWHEQIPGDWSVKVMFDEDPTTPASGWGLLDFNQINLNDRNPRLTVDGEGTMSNSVSGKFHLIWTTATVWVNYSSVNTDYTGGWSPWIDISDSGSSPSAAWSGKGVTTQNRGGTWFPAVNWVDGRMVDWEIFYTTPGSRVMVDANMTGLYAYVDGVNITLPGAYNWPAGLNHTLYAPSPQYINATARAAWLDWSDTGAQTHDVLATTTDTTYTAGFMLQYRIDFDPSPMIGGFEIEVDGTPHSIPTSFWWWITFTYQIYAPEPQQQTGSERWMFDSWSDGGGQMHDITVWGAKQYTVYFVRQFRVVIDTNPTSLTVEVDSIPYTAPWTGWCFEGDTIMVNAPSPQMPGPPDTRYVYSSWSDGGAQMHSILISNAMTRTAFYDTQYTIDFHTDPDGLDLMIDNVTYGMPVSFWWNDASSHRINAISPQNIAVDDRFIFNYWSDFGPQEHDIGITMPDTYTAYYTRQYYLTVTSPYGMTTGEDWYDESTDAYAGLNTDVVIIVPQAERQVFDQWSGDASGTDFSQSFPILMNSPKQAVATWNREYYLTVQTPYGNPSGEGWYMEGGLAYAGLDTDTWVISPNAERWVFSQWGGDATGTDYTQSDSIIMSMPKTATAAWNQEFYLTVTSLYGTTSGDGYYPAMSSAYAGLDTDVYVVIPNSDRYVFDQWSGDATGTNYSQSDPIVMDSPRNAQALWRPQYYLTVSSPYGTTSGEGWYDELGTAYAGLDIDTWVTIPNEERWVFTQWSGDASGTNFSQSAPVTMDGPKMAQANWQQQFYLNVSSPYGTTSGAGWYDGGSVAYTGLDIDLFVVTPNAERWYFVRWGGDVTGNDYLTSDPISMDQPMWAVAIWQQQFYFEVTSPYGTTSGQGWYDSGDLAYAGLDIDTYEVMPNQERFVFTEWGVDATGSDYVQSDQVLMDAPKTAGATWQRQYYLDVQSPYGTPSGSGYFDENTGVPASVDTDVYVVTPNAERWIFSQWTGDATGTDYAASDPIVMDGPKTAIAEWQHQYYLTVDSPYGTPTGEGWYNDGVDAYAGLDTDTWVVVPFNERYVFTSWGMDATGSNYLQSDAVLMNFPKTATATWQHQYWIIIRAEADGNPLVGVDVSFDMSVVGQTPHTEWYDAGITYDIGVEDPVNIGGTDYDFLYWDFGPSANPVSYDVIASVTLIAEYQETAPPQYFEVYGTPASRQISPGQSTTYYVNVTSENGYAGQVTLSISGLPAPAQGAFSVNPVDLSSGETEMVILTVSNTGSLTAGTLALQITGTDGVLSDGASVDLDVVIVPYFTVSVTPPSAQIEAGENATYTVSVTSMNGYAGDVDLSVSGLPGAAAGAFNPAYVTLTDGATETSVLTISDTGAVAAGTYVLTITGTQGALSESDQVDLEVTVPATGTINGSVVDQDSNPLAGALVELVSVSTVVDSMTTNSSGGFSFTNVTAGNYTVRATLSGYQEAEENVTLPPGLVREITLSMNMVEGYVTGRVRDEVTLEFIEGVTVEFYDMDVLLATVQTSPTGQFAVGALPLGTFDIRFSAEGYRTETLVDQEVTELTPLLDIGIVDLTPEEEEPAPVDLMDYLWVIVVIILVVVILVLLMKRRTPAEEMAEEELEESIVELDELEDAPDVMDDEDWDSLLEETLDETD